MFNFLFKHPLFQAVQRNAFAIWLLLAVGNLFINLAEYWPQAWGEMGAPLLRGFGFVSVGTGVAKLMYCFIDPNTKSKELHDAVMNDRNIAAGVALVARAVIIGVIIIMTCSASRAAELPKTPPAQALAVLPILKQEQQAYWPDLTMPSYLAAQIEQETGPCTKTSKTCWNAGAQLKTCREWGVGYYQFTAAYSVPCRIVVRFDTLTETVNHYPRELKGMSWQHWNDPRLQLRAGVLKSRDMAKKITGAKDQFNQLAFLASAWNGGMGGLSNDRLSCRAAKGCDPSVWFGNVELHSLKSKTDIPGYGAGQSPFNINRTYVKNLMYLFRPKYESLDKII